VQRVLADLDEELAIKAIAPTPEGATTTLKDAVSDSKPAVIYIDAPTSGVPVAGKNLRLNYVILSDQIVTGLQTQVDGALTGIVPLSGAYGWGTRTGYVDVSVPGPGARVGLVATTEDGKKSEPALVRVLWDGGSEKRLPAPKRLFGLIVDVGKYDSRYAAPLGNVSAGDADAFERAVRAQFAPGGAFRVNSSLVRLSDKNGSVTRRDMDTELAKLVRAAEEPDSVALFYFSGHGLALTNGASFLLPSDYNGEPLVTGFPADSLVNALAGRRGTTLVFLDACQSGGVLQGTAYKRLNATKVYNDYKAAGFITYASSLKSQPSQAIVRSLFTEAAVEALTGQAAGAMEPGTKNVTVYFLGHYIFTSVRSRTGHQQWPVALQHVDQDDLQDSLDVILARFK
jgi:hypothetical protein